MLTEFHKIPIIILFFSILKHKWAPIFLKFYLYRFDIQYFIPNLLIASFLRLLYNTSVLWQVGGHVVAGKSPIFSLSSPWSQIREKSCHPVFTKCGEPWSLFSLRNYNNIAINNIWQIMKSALRSSFLFPSSLIKWRIRILWLHKYHSILNFLGENAKHQSQVLFPIVDLVVGFALYTNIITWLWQ